MQKVRGIPAILFCLWLAWCASARGLDPSLEISQYAHTAWKIREGFAAGVIHQVAQTPDGYLWLATEAGLLRFDGVRTVAWTPPAGERLPSDNVRGVMAARDGTLWLGTAKGLVSFKDGQLVHYPEFDGQDVYSIIEDHEGSVWAAGVVWEGFPSHSGKLCEIKLGRTNCYGSDGRFGFGVTAIHEDKRGNLWLGAGNGVWRWKPGPPQTYVPPLPLYGEPSLIFGRSALLDEGPDGLIVAANNGITHFVSGKLQRYPFLSVEEQTEPTLLRDRDGALWIGTLDAGLVHVHEGKVDVFTKADGLSGAPIYSLFEDREGNIWVATANGLDRFREYAFPTINNKQGLSSSNLTCIIAASDGSVWFGLSDALNRWNNGKVTVYRPSRVPEPGAVYASEQQTRRPFARSRLGNMVREVSAPELPGYYINSLYQDAQSRVWIATSNGLAYVEGDHVYRLTNAKVSEVNAMVGDSLGNLWIASGEQGLARLRDGKVVEQIPWRRLGISAALSNPLAADPVNGGVWVASWNGGVIWFRDGQVRQRFGAKEGLGSGRVNFLQADRQGAIWAATDAGLSRIKDGHVATMRSSNGLPCDTVHDIIEDDAGSFWLRSACGLVRIARTELSAWAANPQLRIQTHVFDASDGVLGHAGAFAPTPRVAKTADGRLWFLRLGEGVSVVDPKHIISNNVPPPVHVEQVIADGKAYDASDVLRLPARVRNLTINYTALSLVAPEKVRFRYKLEGQDKEWREVVNDRRVQYSNLAPKNYRFRVIAANDSEVWNEQGDTLEFSIAPEYWQTKWFRALCIAIFVTLLWAAYRFRTRQLAQQFSLTLEARVAERTRIARELHDTLLQSLNGLLFRFQAARNLLPTQTEKAQQVLDTAISRTAEAIRESRHAIQEIRSESMEQRDLPDLLTQISAQLASTSDTARAPTFGVTVEGDRRKLSPLVQEEIYRIARELLRNAFQHSKASRIEAELRYGRDVFCLRIRDDGTGIDLKLLREGRDGHWGLRGAQERAQRIGAKIEFWSEVAAGTEAQLTVPAVAAYQERRDGLLYRLMGQGKAL